MGAIKLKGRSPVWEKEFSIAGINLKHNLRLSVLVSVAIVLLAPVIFGTANLDRKASAVPLEMFVSLIGIVLLTPVYQPEQNEELDDLVSSKSMSQTRVCLIRVLCAAAILTALIGLFCVYLGFRSCDVSLLSAAGTVANAVFLGSLGMMTAALSGSTVIAYMIPMVYYTLNYGMGARLGHYWLFSISVEDYAPKAWLFLTGIVLIAGSLAVKRLKRRFR